MVARLDDDLHVVVLVARYDEEPDGRRAERLVLAERELDRCRAGRVAALAEEVERPLLTAGRETMGDDADLLVEIAEQHLVLRDAPFPVVHRTRGAAIQPSVSIGVVSYPDDGRTADELLITADSSMYRSKRAGRNRVTGVDMPGDDVGEPVFETSGRESPPRTGGRTGGPALAAVPDPEPDQPAATTGRRRSRGGESV